MKIYALLYHASWQAVTFLTYILEVTDLNLNGILTVLAETVVGLSVCPGSFWEFL